jgi:hypothetical protein
VLFDPATISRFLIFEIDAMKVISPTPNPISKFLANHSPNHSDNLPGLWIDSPNRSDNLPGLWIDSPNRSDNLPGLWIDSPNRSDNLPGLWIDSTATIDSHDYYSGREEPEDNIIRL